MKALIKTALVVSTLLFFCTINAGEVRGQVTAVGHISAEVVESVSASAKVNTGFELRSAAGKTAPVEENLVLGTMTIHSGQHVSCNVVVQDASLTNRQGNSFTVSPDLTPRKSQNGTSTLQLSARPKIDASLPSGDYRGNYTLVFAYN